jgi:hypothetical protein
MDRRIDPHAVTILTQEIQREAAERMPELDIADPDWRRRCYRAAKRLLEAREDELQVLLTDAPTRG